MYTSFKLTSSKNALIFILGALLLSCVSSIKLETIQIDRQKLLDVADKLELTNLLQQQESRLVTPLATPVEVSEGNFEIKCSTSCDFVPRGNGGDQVLLHQTRDSYIQVAEELALAQERLLAAKTAVEATPGDNLMEEACEAAEQEVQRKTFALQAIVGGRVPTALANDATSALKKNLAKVEAELMTSPDDEVLAKKKSDIEAALNGIAQNPETDAADQIAELKNKYDILKVQLAETPDDAAVNAELNAVESAIAQASGDHENGSTLSPKKECYRVCVNPHLPENSGTDKVDNCVRMCVKVMRSLVYNMAKKVL